MVFETEGPEQTEGIAAEMATSLEWGDVVLVSGELGSGKTTFVRGACRALGVAGPVTSPTFSVGQLYRGELCGRRVEVAHLDLYRLSTLTGEEPGLLDDYVTPERIAFVEWPEIAEPALDRVSARVLLRHLGGDRRALELEDRRGPSAGAGQELSARSRTKDALGPDTR